MEISNLHLHGLRNAGHYQFHTDFNSFVLKYTPQALNLVDAYERYHSLLEKEGEALVVITKSATTEQISNADRDRDVTLRGMTNQIRSYLNHFDPAVRLAASRLLVIVESYGKLGHKPNDEESAAITKLIADLRNRATEEMNLLSLVDWIDELERQNTNFIDLEAARNSEEANRTELRMKLVRVEVDAAYLAIVKRINALIVVNGEAPYVEFVKELNARIGRAQDAIAQSKARAIKADAVVVPA